MLADIISLLIIVPLKTRSLMPMPQYTISPTAIRDLEDIIDYFTERNVEAGDRLLNEFTKKCRYLTQFPLLQFSDEYGTSFSLKEIAKKIFLLKRSNESRNSSI